MITISFKNLEPSQLARQSVQERILGVVGKFPDLKVNQIKIVLEMKNSRLQAGLDMFSIQLHIVSGRYENIKITKSSPNLYVALAELCDLLLSLLNRHGDRARVKSTKLARKIKKSKFESELDILVD